MISRPLVLGLLAAGCVTAAAGGAYVAVRQNAAELAAPPAAAAPQAAATPSPVAETEAIVDASPAVVPASTALQAPPQPEAVRKPPAAMARTTSAPASRPRSAPVPEPIRPAPVATSDPGTAAMPDTSAAPIHRPAPAVPAMTAGTPAAMPGLAPLPPPEPEFVQVVVPASSVIGLQVETSLSSERARVEDRVEARVTRDVSAEGRVAVPAGSRVLGSVTLVERGGKIKERARLGVRFHTLVLASGMEIPILTETIFREGDSPGNESARKIGGAAAGGAILGALIGGGKGALIGSATGAAGGTAVVMAGDRNAATLTAGTVLTVRLTDPVTVDVEKR
ncbi:MAG TPA: hypothetical protein VLD67_09650 [Vicinamibacterales bacterium]|nr:hypothetical protein [Vicinamibacterales bacterium]